MEKTITGNLPVALSDSVKISVFAATSLLSFFVPFGLGHPQWLVGTVVNTCLFLSATFLSKKFCVALVILPSLGVLARGLVFGPFTYFLVYFLPFIWLGNLVLVLAFKRVGFIAAAGAKFLFLFLVANIYFNFNIIPKIFLQAMGLNQLATALAGGAIAFIILKIYGQFKFRG